MANQTIFGADADMWPCAKGKHDRCRGQIIDKPTDAVWVNCPCQCHQNTQTAKANSTPATVPAGEHETVTTCGQCRVLRHRESEPARVEFCSRHVAIVNSFAAMREALRKVLAEYDGPNSNCPLGSFYADEVLPKCSDETAEIVRAALAASGGGK